MEAITQYFVQAEGFGECELLVRQSQRTFDDELVVVRADPRILVTAEFLDQIRRTTENFDELGWPSFATLRDDILTLNGVNQKVIYRIGEHLMEPDCYVAEWPD